MYSFNQRDFKRNINSCWLAGQIIQYANNIAKEPITQELLDSVEDYVYNDYTQPMPLNWLSIIGWLKRISWRANVRMDKKTKYRLFSFWGEIFNMYMDAGYVISVALNVTQEFMDDWKSWKDIDRDYTGWKVIGSHVIDTYRKDWVDYLLNSRDPATNIRKVNLECKWLFKDWEKCGLLLPL